MGKKGKGKGKGKKGKSTVAVAPIEAPPCPPCPEPPKLMQPLDACPESTGPHATQT